MNEFTATATLVSAERKRPPKQVLRLDITIDGTPRDGWILVADSVRTVVDVTPRGIHTIDRYEVEPGCHLVWLKGERGVLAVRPGSSRLVVRNLAVNRWDDANVVGIATTGGIMVDGQHIESLFETPIARWPDGAVDAASFSAGAAIVQRRAADFDHPFDVAVDDAVAHAVRLD